jgi:CRISPR-associated protein Cas2
MSAHSNRQFVLVVYDISDDRRRTRLHDRLLDYGSPVQYSVFECLLSARELARLRRMVKKVTRPRLDDVRYYFLCAACREKIETLQGIEGPQRPGGDVVV